MLNRFAEENYTSIGFVASIVIPTKEQLSNGAQAR